MRDAKLKTWSDELQILTKKFIVDTMPAAMKNIHGQFGVMGYREGKIVIFDRTKVGKQYVYETSDALIDDGWAVD